MNVPSSLAKPSSVSLDAVAQHETVLRQLVGDRQHGGADPRIVRRQEPHQRHQQQRGVEGGGVVVLDEHAALIDAVGADVRVDLLGGRLPARGDGLVVADLGQPRAAVGGDPAHHLRGGEVLGIAAHLPDPTVGLAPALERLLHLALDDRPQPVGKLVARFRVEVDRVEHRAPHVVLILVVGAVADPHRPRLVIARQMLEHLLLELALAADPVHDLQLALLGLGHVGDEVEEVVGLLVEAQRVERPEHEGRVADPAVAVIPVAVSARRLGQRRGAGRDHRSRGRVREPLEGQRAALQVRAPGVIRERAVLEPLLPEAARARQPGRRLLVARRQRMGGPAERDERALALVQRRSRARPWPLEAESQVGHEPQLEVHPLRARPPPRCIRSRYSPSRRPGRRSRTPARTRA